MRCCLVVCLVALGCGRLDATTLVITTQSVVPVDQLRHEARDETGRLVFGPALRPETAGGALAGTNGVRVLLPDAEAGKLLKVRVDALSAAAVVAQGRALVRVELGREVRVTVALEAEADCQGCRAPDASCLSPSSVACGAAGAACASCEVPSADGCVAGACSCGGEATCAAGQACVAGQCACTPDSCAGCCSNGACLDGDVDAACGKGGGNCKSCNGSKHCGTKECR